MTDHQPNAEHKYLDGTLRIVNDEHGRPDDVFAKGVGLIRFERMNEQHFWGAIYHPDDKQNKRINFHFNAIKGPDGEPLIALRIEEDNG